MKKTFCTYILLLFLCSCSNNNNQDMTNVKNIIEIPLLDKGQTWNYSEIYKDVKYVALDCSDENALIGDIFQLEISKEGDYIAFDDENKKIVRYDCTGKFCNLIGERGNSKGEYISPSCITYDPYAGQVLVMDNAKKSILFYDMNGNYYHSLELKKNVYAFKVIDKNKILLFFDYSEGNDGYNYWIIDKNGNILSQFEEIPVRPDIPYLPCRNRVFSNWENGVYCMSHNSSIIYEVTAKSVKPIYSIKGKDITLKVGLPFDIEKTYKLNTTNEILSFCKVKGTIIISFNINERVFMYSINKSGEIHAGHRPINDIYGPNTYGNRLSVHDNNLYFSVEPWLFESYYKRIKGKDKFDDMQKEEIHKLSQHHNPIIQICTVKD